MIVRRGPSNMAQGSPDPSAELCRPLRYPCSTPTLSLFDPYAMLPRPLCGFGSDPRAELGPTHERSWVRPTSRVGSDPRAELGPTHGRSWVRPRIARGSDPTSPPLHRTSDFIADGYKRRDAPL